MTKDPAKDGLTTEPLGKHHDRAAFSCGAPELDRYLQRQASQDARRNVAAPFVLCAAGSAAVIGYYTLSAISIDAGELPDDITRKLPRYPDVPAVLIGRLAVDAGQSGKGLGKYLLVDALRRAWEGTAQIAAAAVIVEARDEDAASFYEHFGFRRFPDHANRLFMPMQTVAALFR